MNGQNERPIYIVCQKTEWKTQLGRRSGRRQDRISRV
jgi:hypothetical protein